MGPGPKPGIEGVDTIEEIIGTPFLE